MSEARKGSLSRMDSTVDQVKSFREKYGSQIAQTIFFGLCIIISLNFVMLVIGSINFHKCPANSKIPVFLIVIGVMGILASVLTNLRTKNVISVDKIEYLESILHFASLAVFIAGSVWVYGIWQPSYEEGSLNYCNKTCYLFAFIYITIIYAMLALVIGLLCLGCCCAICCAGLIGCVQNAPENV